MKGDLDEFNKYLKEKVEKENESKANGVVNKEDIPTNPENKGSGTEGVRKETE